MATEKDQERNQDASMKAEPMTIYHPVVVAEIKSNVSRVWERVRKNRNLTQSNLAKALGTTQGAISKLLNNANGHPWTEPHLRKFAEFCQISPSEFLNEESVNFVIEWSNDEQLLDQNFVEECVSALQNYVNSKGISAHRAKISGLAAKLAARLEGTHPNSATMEREIERIILENALDIT